MNLQKLNNLLKDPKTNWKYIIIVAILAFISGAITMNYLSKTRFEFPQITFPKRIDETADWKTYRNEKYGCEFMYPSDWVLDLDSVIRFLPVPEKRPAHYTSIKEHGFLEISRSDKYNPDLGYETTLEDWFSGKAEGRVGLEGGKYKKRKSVTVAGIESLILEDLLPSSYSPSKLVVFLPKDELIYKITMGIWGEVFSEERFEKFLSTFKFVEGIELLQGCPPLKFEDFSISDKDRCNKEELAKVDFDSDPRTYAYITAITYAVQNEGPNFAGCYTLVEMGCGSNCSVATIINGRTGEIITFNLNSDVGIIKYRANSRLLIVYQQPFQTFQKDYYELKNNELEFICSREL